MDIDRQAVLPLLLAPATAYREVLYRPGGELSGWIGERFEILAGPGRALTEPPRPGDVLLSVTLGQPGRGECGVLTDANLTPRPSARGAQPGWYTTVTGATAARRRRRVLDVYRRVPAGRLLLRQRAAAASDTASSPPTVKALGDPIEAVAESEGFDSNAWSGSAEQIEFRDRVLAAHLARSQSKRVAPLPDLSGGALEKVPGTDINTLPGTAAAAGRLLTAAAVDLAKAQQAEEPDALRTIRLTVTSGYRGSGHQRELWLRYFSAKGGYYDRTQAAREKLPDGPHSVQAIDYLLKPKKRGGFGLGGRIAAPGYSNHQGGIAVDLFQERRKGHYIANKSDDASRARWRATWFHHWLNDNAAAFGFRPIESEEWHWEFRAGSTAMRRSRPPATAKEWTEAYDEGAPQDFPASRLEWPGRSTAEVAFMRDVYNRQLAVSETKGTYTADLANVPTIEGEEPHRARADAAEAVRALLASARTKLAADGLAGRVRIGIVSAYRPARQQFLIWQGKNRSGGFPFYYQEMLDEGRLQRGDFGSGAVEKMASRMSEVIAAPGYSNHQDGLAIDFGIGDRQKGGLGKIGTKSWFHKWLISRAAPGALTNARRFGFHPLAGEPWHWTYRGGAVQEAWSDEVTPGAICAAEMRIPTVPLLSSHRGSPPDMIVGWNDMSSMPEAIDVAVHLHGYSYPRPKLLDAIKPVSGLDLAPKGSARRRSRPTLTVLPRGHDTGIKQKWKQKDGTYKYGFNKFTFPALVAKDGLTNLIRFALDRFAKEVGGPPPRLGRLILTAHSGGGAALLKILEHTAPDQVHEVHVFDGLYQDASALAKWARTRMQSDRTSLQAAGIRPADDYMRAQGGALRVFYQGRIRGGTKPQSLRLRDEIAGDLGSGLERWYRVEASSYDHFAIPRNYGWRVLIDAAADVPEARTEANATRARDSEDLEIDEGEPSFESVPLAALVLRTATRSWSYQFTPEDLVWTAKLLVHEAGGGDNPNNAAVLWAMFNRYALFTYKKFGSFGSFVRSYSTTLQPVLRSPNAAARHMHRPPSEFVRTGGIYPGTDIPKGQLRRHLDIQQAPWTSIKRSARELATRALTGQLANPGIGLASEFASTKIYFHQKYGRNPDVQEWRRYTEDLAARKRWRWVGDVPGLNQLQNAFFVDRRAVGLPNDTVRVLPPPAAAAHEAETSFDSETEMEVAEAQHDHEFGAYSGEFEPADGEIVSDAEVAAEWADGIQPFDLENAVPDPEAEVDRDALLEFEWEAEEPATEGDGAAQALQILIVDERGQPLVEGEYAVYQGDQTERGRFTKDGKGLAIFKTITTSRPFVFEVRDRVCAILTGAFIDPDDPAIEYGGTWFDWTLVRDNKNPDKTFWPSYLAEMNLDPTRKGVDRFWQHEHIVRRPIRATTPVGGGSTLVKIRAIPTQIRTGPIVRYTDHHRASVWVESATPSLVKLRVKRAGGREDEKTTYTSTVRVGGRHFAIAEVDGLGEDTFYGYTLELAPIPASRAAVPVDPEDIKAVFPEITTEVRKAMREQLSAASVERIEWLKFRTLRPRYDKSLRFATGSCRWYPGDVIAGSDGKPKDWEPDMLDKLGEWLRKTPTSQWPHFQFYGGDQIYADEIGERHHAELVRARFASRLPGPKDPNTTVAARLIDGAWAGRFAHRLVPLKPTSAARRGNIETALKRIADIYDAAPVLRLFADRRITESRLLEQYKIRRGRREISGKKSEDSDEREARVAVQLLPSLKSLLVTAEPFRVYRPYWTAVHSGVASNPQGYSYRSCNFLLWKLPNAETDLPTLQDLSSSGEVGVRGVAGRAHPSADRGRHVADFAEYAFLYERAWTTSPNVRMVLGNVPTFLMFDDHEVTDDWNFDVAWVRMVHSQRDHYRMWPKTITDALCAYWIYQGLGNKARAQWQGDPRAAALDKAQRAGIDALPELRKVIYSAVMAASPRDAKTPFQTGMGLDWHYQLPFEPAFLVPDCRTRKCLVPKDDELRVIDHKRNPPQSETIDAQQIQWLRAALDRCKHPIAFIAPSTPLLLQSKLMEFMTKPEVAARAWAGEVDVVSGLAAFLGSTKLGIASAELIRLFRREKDLEHMVRDKSWRDIWGLLDQMRRQRSPVKTLVLVSGDVHHSYCMTGNLSGDGRPFPELLQITSSGLKTTIRGGTKEGVAAWQSSFSSDIGQQRIRPGYLSEPGSDRKELALYRNAVAVVDVSLGADVDVRVVYLAGNDAKRVDTYVYQYTSGPAYLKVGEPAITPWRL